MAMVAADTPSHPWALSKGESVCEDCSRFTTVIFSLQSKIGLHIALPSLLASVESPMESSRSFAVSTMRVWALPPASLVASFNRAFLRSPWCFFPWFWNNPLGLPVLLGFWIGVATTLGDFVLLKKKKKNWTNCEWRKHEIITLRVHFPQVPKIWFFTTVFFPLSFPFWFLLQVRHLKVIICVFRTV